jgi:uncharacterized protein YodC (DUF2158 family)
MKNKFKAGDLVELSAAGKRAQQNTAFVGGFGFIETIMVSEQAYPIRCKWWNADMKVINGHFKPYELKFYKNK